MFPCWSSLADPAPLAEHLRECARRHPFLKGICMDALRFANTAFEAENPGITVDVTTLPYGDYGTAIQTDLAAGTEHMTIAGVTPAAASLEAQRRRTGDPRSMM